MTQEPERTVYVFVITEEGIPFRQRSHRRKTEPDNFGATAAGHIEPGESPYEGGLRELEEETGIKASRAEFEHGYFGMMPRLITRSPGNPDRPLEGYVFLIDRSGMKAETIHPTSEHSGLMFVANAEKLSQLIEQTKNQRLVSLGRSADWPLPQITLLPLGTDLTNPTKDILLSPVGEKIRQMLYQKAAKPHRMSTS